MKELTWDEVWQFYCDDCLIIDGDKDFSMSFIDWLKASFYKPVIA